MPEPLEQPELQDPPEPVAPAPQYVPLEDFKRLEQVIAGQTELINSMNQNFQSLAARASREAPPAPKGEMSDEDIEAAVNDGRMTQLQAARLISKREIEALRQSEIVPLRDSGTSAIGVMAKQMAMPLMPHYKRFQKEVDALLDSVPSGSKITTETYLKAYQMVVGAHVDELLEEKREETVRAAAAPKPEAAPPARSGRTNAAGKVPTVEELMGEQAAKALAGKGMTEDQWAKRLGYKDWATYAKLQVDQEAGAA